MRGADDGVSPPLASHLGHLSQSIALCTRVDHQPCATRLRGADTLDDTMDEVRAAGGSIGGEDVRVRRLVVQPHHERLRRIRDRLHRADDVHCHTVDRR